LILFGDRERVVPHNLDRPVTHKYRGHQLFLKFDWEKPNDAAPSAAHVLEKSEVPGLANTVADIIGPWPDYRSALAEAISAGERWIDSQSP
jgi:hypothetical protein